jgi:outer membrane protein assembly factor BamB
MSPPTARVFRCRVASTTAMWVAGMVALLGTVARAAEPGAASWPSFRNGNSQVGIAHTDLPAKLELLWTHNTGEMIQSAAAIVDGFVYGASLKGEAFCLDKRDGKRVWTYRSKETANPNEFIPGFKASPLVTGDSVYLGDEDGVFHAIDRRTGKGRWTFSAGAEIVSSATRYEDKIVFGSHDNSLYCLFAKDGKVAWSYATEGMVNCSPAIIEHFTFVTGCDEHLRVLDLRTGEQTIDLPLGSYLIASPAVVGDKLYVGTYAATVLGVDWKAGKIDWTYKDPKREFPYHSCAAVTDKFVVLGGQDKRVHCIDRTTGNKVWLFDTRAKVNSSPAIVGDRVFIGSDDGNLYELDLPTGKERWRYTDGSKISAGIAVGEGVLVVGSESRDGRLHCFGAKP